MSVKSKMTAIADRIRALLGVADAMGLDDMAESLEACQDTVDLQADLLDQALLAIDAKISGSESLVSQDEDTSIPMSDF